MAREKRITARFADEEYELIERLASELEITRSELVRLSVLYYLESEKLSQELQRIAKQRKLYRRLIGRIGRLGNLLNQIARTLNMCSKYGEIPSEEKEKLSSSLVLVERVLESLLREFE